MCMLIDHLLYSHLVFDELRLDRAQAFLNPSLLDSIINFLVDKLADLANLKLLSFHFVCITIKSLCREVLLKLLIFHILIQLNRADIKLIQIAGNFEGFEHLASAHSNLFMNHFLGDSWV